MANTATEQTNQTNPQTQQAALVKTPANDVATRLAAHYGVSRDELWNTIANTCIKDATKVTQEQFIAFLMIADRSGLNPMLGELYAFPSKTGGIVPVIGVNGLRQIAARSPDYCGLRWEFSDEEITIGSTTCCKWICCVIKRRNAAGQVDEYPGYAFFVEKYRSESEPWRKQPRQMLMNKAQIQAIKNAFESASGIYDFEEGREAAGLDPMASASGGYRYPKTIRAWERKELDAKLVQVERQAQVRSDWAGAAAWAMDNCAGEDQEYALKHIAFARVDAEKSAKVKSEAEDVQDVPVAEPPASVVEAADTAMVQPA